MALTEAEVRKVGDLARLALTDDEIPRFQGELAAIVDFVEQLQTVDVSSVAPIAQVTGLSQVLRADEVRPMLSPEQALSGAPQHNGQAFLVPKAVER